MGDTPGKEAQEMRYDVDEALRRTLERASALRARSARRRISALSAGAGVSLCALAALGYALAAQGTALVEADYGAFLLPSHAGGYVLAGVLAFAAGVLVTLLCLRYRDRHAPPLAGSGREEKSEHPDESGDR